MKTNSPPQQSTKADLTGEHRKCTHQPWLEFVLFWCFLFSQSCSYVSKRSCLLEIQPCLLHLCSSFLYSSKMHVTALSLSSLTSDPFYLYFTPDWFYLVSPWSWAPGHSSLLLLSGLSSWYESRPAILALLLPACETNLYSSQRFRDFVSPSLLVHPVPT